MLASDGPTNETRDTAAMRGMEGVMRMMAIAILAAGILALAYGGFSYTKETHDAKIGPLEISVSENRRVNVPMWAGVALAVVGGGLLVAGKK
jgi:TRAP-type C4-dicarboxylate transport system permease small subunit